MIYPSIHGRTLVFDNVLKDYNNINSKWSKEGDDPYIDPHESFLANLKDSKVIQNIADNIEEAKVFYEGDTVTFTEKELSWMYAFAFKRCLNVRHNANGTIFMSGNLDKIASKFIKKLENILPGCSESPSVAGNFFITPSQYGLHTDSTRETDWINSFVKTPEHHEKRRFVPWRNVLIPLWIGNKPDTVSHAVFFKQRHIDFAHVYLHDSSHDNDPATTYPIIRDHKTIDFHGSDGKIIHRIKNTLPYDKDHHAKYLAYTPYARLTGLTPELTCEWVPGKPLVFDAFQLHATNKGTNILYRKKYTYIDREHHDPMVSREEVVRESWDTKMGLLLTFLREVK